jgi:hypothetical protein
MCVPRRRTATARTPGRSGRERCSARGRARAAPRRPGHAPGSPPGVSQTVGIKASAVLSLMICPVSFATVGNMGGPSSRGRSRSSGSVPGCLEVPGRVPVAAGLPLSALRRAERGPVDRAAAATRSGSSTRAWTHKSTSSTPPPCTPTAIRGHRRQGTQGSPRRRRRARQQGARRTSAPRIVPLQHGDLAPRRGKCPIKRPKENRWDCSERL